MSVILTPTHVGYLSHTSLLFFPLIETHSAAAALLHTVEMSGEDLETVFSCSCFKTFSLSSFFSLNFFEKFLRGQGHWTGAIPTKTLEGK